MASVSLDQRPADIPPGAGSRLGKRTVRAATPYLLLAPAAGLFLLFIAYPIYRQFDVSFYDWHIFPGVANPFVGWSNYSHVFHDPAIRTAAWNTLLFLVITVPIQMGIGLFAAAILTDRMPGRGFWRALVFIPVITSWVVVSYIFAYIFADQGGVANAVISLFAGHSVHIDWLAQTWTGNAVIWLVSIWKGVGWSFIMFLAALDGVPRDLVEAGRVDGAKELRVWRHVVIPNIRPTIAFVLVILVIGASQVFTQIFILTSGGPYGSTSTLMTYAYQQAFSFFSFSYAAAIASVMAIVVVVFSVIQIRLLRSGDRP